jgi:hypothetical protein
MKAVYLVKKIHTNSFDYMSTPKKMYKIFFDAANTDCFGVYPTKAKAMEDVAKYNFMVAK